ncbi:unnamed protein product [Protopolystoma xenopodis]|uniref:Uncharacterized protein n=1 Tax=Protopolystoma xenopodis TaxID=117903 RepID=A0A3S5CV69_9PLAT|nr:unnamed protein product [Protopolystoma xenopodis]
MLSLRLGPEEFSASEHALDLPTTRRCTAISITSRRERYSTTGCLGNRTAIPSTSTPRSGRRIRTELVSSLLRLILLHSSLAHRNTVSPTVYPN